MADRTHKMHFIARIHESGGIERGTGHPLRDRDVKRKPTPRSWVGNGELNMQHTHSQETRISDAPVATSLLLIVVFVCACVCFATDS